MVQETTTPLKSNSIKSGDYFLIFTFVVTFFIFPVLFIWNASKDIHPRHAFLSETQRHVGQLIQIFKVQTA
jgi:hypothetical protein